MYVSAAISWVRASEDTVWKEDWADERGTHFLVDRKLSVVKSRVVANHLTESSADEQVVGEGNTVPGSDLEDLMLTVAVERRPLNVGGVLGPIEGGGMALMTDNKLTSFMSCR